MKKRNSMYRLSALLIAIAVFVSATYIPSMATNLYDQYMEQKKVEGNFADGYEKIPSTRKPNSQIG